MPESQGYSVLSHEVEWAVLACHSVRAVSLQLWGLFQARAEVVHCGLTVEVKAPKARV